MLEMEKKKASPKTNNHARTRVAIIVVKVEKLIETFQFSRKRVRASPKSAGQINEPADNESYTGPLVKEALPNNVYRSRARYLQRRIVISR